MRDCPGNPSTTRTAEGPHSSGAAVVSSSGSGRPARAHVRPNATSNAATAGPQTASIVSRQGARPAPRLPAHSSPTRRPPVMWRRSWPGIGGAPVARWSARENASPPPPPSEGQRRLHRTERLDTERDVIVERDAELLGPLAYLIAVHTARERFVLEFLLDRRDLEVRKTLGGAHQRARDQESAQLVYRKERLRHGRIARYARVGGVSQHRSEQRLGHALGAQQIDPPGGMALGG